MEMLVIPKKIIQKNLRTCTHLFKCNESFSRCPNRHWRTLVSSAEADFFPLWSSPKATLP